MEKGLLHIYTGDGKGKTTAAMGLCLRAAGHDKRIGIAQFLKDGKSGEINSLSKFENIYIFPYFSNVKFTFVMNLQEKQEARNFYKQLLDKIKLKCDALDILLLDEVIAAITTGILDKESLLEFLNTRPSWLEVILTGRNPPAELIEIADYISEIRMIRHPYEKGIQAREGIEW